MKLSKDCFNWRKAGFSLVELMIGVGMVGGISIGVAQLVKNSTTQSAKFNDKMELRSLVSIISQEYSKSDVCTLQFGGKPVVDNEIILNSGGNLLLKKDLKVVNDHYIVEQVETLGIDKSRFQLKLTFKDLRPGANNILVVEKLAITADVNQETQTITNCYEPGSLSLDTEGADETACQGPGIVFPHPPDGSCEIKGFNTYNLNCASGLAIVSVTATLTGNYTLTNCVEPFETVKNCPNSHIRNHDLAGEIDCVQLSNNVIPTPAEIVDGQECKVVAANNGSIQFVCNQGTVPVCPASAYCPPANTYCAGVSVSNGCGGTCPTGTQPTGCDSCVSDCPNPNTYCPLDLTIDICGNTCPTGTKVHGCYANNNSCPDAYCPPRNTYCPSQPVDNGCGQNCPTGTKSAGCNRACFVAGTLVDLLSGEMKNIEDVVVGDKLLDGSRNTVTVEKLLITEYHGLIYSVNGSGYFFTPNHPFLTIGGWKSLDPIASNIEIANLDVTMLKVGDVLMKNNGMEIIYSLDYMETKEVVYNFQLNGSHEYIANGFIVHNKMDCPHVTCGNGPSYACGQTSMPSGYASEFCTNYQCTPCN